MIASMAWLKSLGLGQDGAERLGARGALQRGFHYDLIAFPKGRAHEFRKLLVTNARLDRYGV